MMPSVLFCLRSNTHVEGRAAIPPEEQTRVEGEPIRARSTESSRLRIQGFGIRIVLIISDPLST